MDDIHYIVRETIRVSLPEFVRLLFAATGGGLIGAYLTDRLTRKREKESAMMADKRAFVPLIDPLIRWAKKGEGIGYIRFESEKQLTAPAMRFRMHLKGERLRLFDEAWDTLMKTTRIEVADRQPGDSDETANKMKQTILSRLEAVRKIADDTKS
jgi:hypothetical protein